MSQPAVPEGGGETVNVSTDSHQTRVPTIQVVKDENPMDLPLHTGNYGMIDPQIYQINWLKVTFVWSTSQLAGTILFKESVGPESNIFTSFYSNMYNAWSGGMNYSMKILGTGFHAGLLAVTRIPPNIPPEKLTSAGDLSVFETMYIDPKTLSPVDISIRDQRPVNYHITNSEPMPNPTNNNLVHWVNSFAVGSTIVIWVAGALNTSGSGTDSVQIVLFCRPDLTFRFSQIKPPYVDSGPNINSFRLLLEHSLYGPSGDRLEATGGDVAIELIALNHDVSIAQSTRMLLHGGAGFDGTVYTSGGMEEFIGRINDVNSSKIKLSRYITHKLAEVQGGLFTNSSDTISKREAEPGDGENLDIGLYFPNVFTSCQGLLNGYQVGDMAKALIGSSPSVAFDPEGGSTTEGATNFKTANNTLSTHVKETVSTNDKSGLSLGGYNAIRSGGFAVLPAVPNTNLDTAFDINAERINFFKVPEISIPESESLLVFSAGSTNNRGLCSAQTTSLRRLFEAGEVKKAFGNTSTAAILALRSLDSGQTMTFCKLYPEGFITVPKVTVTSKFDYSRSAFVFIQIVARSAIIPNPSAGLLMHQLAQHVHQQKCILGYPHEVKAPIYKVSPVKDVNILI